MADPATSSAPQHDDVSSWPTGRLLSTAARLVEGAWGERLARRGLTHAGLMALHEIHAASSLPVRELATRCQVTPQTMTRTVDRLERDGLVSRRRGQRDRRRVEVTLTSTGARCYTEAVDMSDAEPALLGDVLDLPALRRSLIAVIEHLTGQPTGSHGRRVP